MVNEAVLNFFYAKYS